METVESEVEDGQQDTTRDDDGAARAGCCPEGGPPDLGWIVQRPEPGGMLLSAEGVPLSHTRLCLVQMLQDKVEGGAEVTWRVYVPDARHLTQLGYPTVSGCCALFHDNSGYGRDPNRYLRDRYRGRWKPRYEDGPSGATDDRKRPSTSKGQADRLAHFLNWTDASGLDVDRMSYEDVLSYQDEMPAARPSGSRPTVGPATRNQRADEATFYLMWRSDLDLRASFNVTAKLIRLPVHGRHGNKFVYARTGRLATSGDGLPTLSLPTPAQKLVWYSALRKRLGQAKMLAAKGSRTSESRR